MEPGDLPDVARAGYSQSTGEVAIQSGTPTRVLNDLTGWAVARGVELDGLSVERPSLEDVYLELTGEASDE
jgi:ABC-2 type transport system ATP-binding protein